MQHCAQLVRTGACVVEVEAWVRCALANLAPEASLCFSSPGDRTYPCQAESGAASVCLEQGAYFESSMWSDGVPPQRCTSGTDASCHCDSQILGYGGPLVAADCTSGDGGGRTCACSIDGAPVGACEETAACQDPCDVYIGCCAGFWQGLGPALPPVGVMCVDDTQSCFCSVTCTERAQCPAEEIARVDCAPADGGPVLCTCTLHGTVVGTCTPPAGQSCAAAQASNPFAGCCADLLPSQPIQP